MRPDAVPYTRRSTDALLHDLSELESHQKTSSAQDASSSLALVAVPAGLETSVQRQSAQIIPFRIIEERRAIARPARLGQGREMLHRAFDIAVAVIAIIALAPAIALLAMILKLDSGGPMLFVQQRVGRYGRMFPCLKFRTMVTDADAVLAHLLATSPEARAEWDRDFKLRDDPRITSIGRLVRKLSLDELPQLLNVLAGHMSIVGPRPIVEQEIERYGPWFSHYCSVRPGLTGLWQVSGRNDISYEERVSLDSRYAHRKSVLFDLRIIGRTIPAVLCAKGSY